MTSNGEVGMTPEGYKRMKIKRKSRFERRKNNNAKRKSVS